MAMLSELSETPNLPVALVPTPVSGAGMYYPSSVSPYGTVKLTSQGPAQQPSAPTAAPTLALSPLDGPLSVPPAGFKVNEEMREARHCLKL